ncbi:hypothetical protein F2Q70_00031257 [Brassica cretica]|uniref:RING-type domain-containing protein n=1 Tax=Brassica cretica TaxID=69181 RepID=A0A8S9FLC3_BRACR|nr:hypothetical protein F2Q70_00031257 [Brassica cretica]
MEMRRTEHEAAVSRSYDCKIVADTPDESYVVFRTSTGVRISSQLNDDDGIICSDESKSDLSDAMPVKDEVTGDGSVTLCNRMSNDFVESESASLEFRVKEEPSMDFENQGEEMVIDIVEKPVVVALAQEEAQSVVEAVSRGSGNECVTVEFKQEPENLETYQSIIPAALILAPKPLQVIRPKAEMLDTPEVIDVESDFLNRIVKQERSGTHVKMEPPVEETKVGALSLSLQVREEKPVYAKKMRRTEHEAAVSRSDDFKTVADTPDESYVVFRTSTGVRISSQLNDDDGIICSDESKSDLSDAMPVKDEVTGDVSQKAPSRAYIEEVIQDIRDGNSKECPICLESADDPILTPCAHRMCRECLLTSWRSASCGLCPICRTVLKKTELISCPTESIFRVDVVKNWKESSKVSELIECLEKIRMSGTGEKSIVFSQWTSFLDLLEIPLRRRGIEFLRFDGKLAQKAREKVLKEFNETNQKTVLLMSLKAGGVGLNLTAASNVFLMHTVEERMQQVQARKQRMIAGALTDEEVRSARLEELKMLFR